MIAYSLCFAIIQKPMEKSYWIFVEVTSFMLTADPPSDVIVPPLYTYLCALSVRHRFTYLTVHFAAISKRNVYWLALKHRLYTWTLARFYYDIGTYCCAFIMLLQVRIAEIQNSNIRGLSLKVNALSCWKYALHQTQPWTYLIVLTNAKLI